MCDELNVRKGPFDRYCNWSVSGENGLGAWKLVGNVPENTPLGKILHGAESGSPISNPPQANFGSLNQIWFANPKFGFNVF